MIRETTRCFRLFSLLALFVLPCIGFAASLLAGPIPNLADTLYFELEDCADRVDVCMGIPTSDLQNYQITLNGSPYASGIQGCDFDTFHLYQYFVLPGNGSTGPYVLQSWEIIGSSVFSATFNTMQDLVDSMNLWDPAANWQLDPLNYMIFGGNPASDYSTLQIWHASLINPEILSREDLPIAQGTQLNLGYGTQQLIVRNIALGSADTAQIYVSCTETETIPLTVFLNETDTFCLDFSELLLPLQSLVNNCGPGIAVDFQNINGDSCVQFTGLSPGIDTACMIACAETGVCDTTLLIVTTLINYQVGSRDIYDTIWEGQSVLHCIDQSVFGGLPLASIQNICPNSSGNYLDISLNQLTYCVSFFGQNSVGTETACIVACDTAGVCDTTNFYFLVKNPMPLIVKDTILLYDSRFFCTLNQTNLETPPMSIQNACPASAGEKVLFEIDTASFCMAYSGLEPGLGSACIYVTDSLGNVDTTYFDIFVKLPSASTESITLMEGDSLTVCIDTLELAGRLNGVVNDCSGAGNVEFFLDEDLLCLDAMAISAGVDSACYIFCDEFNLCDTIIWRVEVLERELAAPNAIEDFISLFEGESAIIDLCLNDSLPNGEWTTLRLLDTFLYFGTAVLDADNCSLEYTSTGGGCSKTETLNYEICNKTACDTSSIYIKVFCEQEPLKFYNGFSPNGDNRNDAFQIAGIEAYPDHTLTIYNRWGLEIFRTQNYQNDWKGTWQNQALPDGVYFYKFDDGAGMQQMGYVLIQR